MSGEEHDEPGALHEKPLPRVDGIDPSFSMHARFDPAECFRTHHQALRERLAAHPHPGILACVASGEELSSTWIAATEDRVRAAVIGRHSRATLALPRNHATAALRHLALLVRTDGGRPIARLLDLQTEIGFADPLGRRFEAIRTDGFTFLSAGGAVLMLVPTGPHHHLDVDPERAWAAVPPRRWLESRSGRKSVDIPEMRAQTEPRETVVQAEDGPRGCGRQLCRNGEIPVGLASVASGDDETHVLISGRALDEGFLIGRYDRCEVGGPEADESLSRVHLLVVREGRRIIAIDTASTNGTYVGDDRVHLMELAERSQLDLGGVLELTWSTCN